jgi:hypothetical protein
MVAQPVRPHARSIVSPLRSLAPLAVAVPLLLAAPLTAQTQGSPTLEPPAATTARPVPGPVYETPEFTRAVQRGTRSRDGQPGRNYWVNRASYSIDATLDDARHRVIAHERVVYRNASPDTLRRLAVHLRQNAFVAGNPRIQPAPVTNGMLFSRVAVNGKAIAAKSTGVTAVPITSMDKRKAPPSDVYTVDGTVMWIPLATPLMPHVSAVLEFAWNYDPPLSPSDGRQGREDPL